MFMPDVVLTLWYLIGLGAFIYCAYIDWQTRKIPNRVTYPCLAGSLVVTLLAGQWPTAIWGGLLAGGILLVPRLIAGPKKAGMGDVKLAALGGVLVGPQTAILALTLAFLVALVVVIPLLVGKRLSWQTAIPFGPYLAVGFGFFLMQSILGIG
ncbi:MAG: prepilin peptidase [Caldilinea sp. CFX5]|nr:prepilin peptidase [Caldilinea sp. CFX5]